MNFLFTIPYNIHLTKLMGVTVPTMIHCIQQTLWEFQYIHRVQWPSKVFMLMQVEVVEEDESHSSRSEPLRALSSITGCYLFLLKGLAAAEMFGSTLLSLS